MGDLLEAIVDADGGLLRVELPVDVAQQERALADCRPADDDGLIIFKGGVLYLTHISRINAPIK